MLLSLSLCHPPPPPPRSVPALLWGSSSAPPAAHCASPLPKDTAAVVLQPHEQRCGAGGTHLHSYSSAAAAAAAFGYTGLETSDRFWWFLQEPQERRVTAFGATRCFSTQHPINASGAASVSAGAEQRLCTARPTLRPIRSLPARRCRTHRPRAACAARRGSAARGPPGAGRAAAPSSAAAGSPCGSAAARCRCRRSGTSLRAERSRQRPPRPAEPPAARPATCEGHAAAPQPVVPVRPRDGVPDGEAHRAVLDALPAPRVLREHLAQHVPAGGGRWGATRGWGSGPAPPHRGLTCSWSEPCRRRAPPRGCRSQPMSERPPLTAANRHGAGAGKEEELPVLARPARLRPSSLGWRWLCACALLPALRRVPYGRRAEAREARCEASRGVRGPHG